MDNPCNSKFSPPRAPRSLCTPWIVLLLLLPLPALVQAQFSYVTNNGAITITGYTGPSGAATIPGTINGLAVTSIGPGAFAYNSGLTSIFIPSSVTTIGDDAFDVCLNLRVGA